MKRDTFFTDHNIESLIIPVDLSGGANQSDWINVALYQYVVLVFFAAVGTAGDDPVYTLLQATAAAGTGSKALNIDTIYNKVGTLTSVAQFTRTTQTAAASYTDAASAEAQKIMAVEVCADDLDKDNGFDFVSLLIPDVGANAQIGCAFAICGKPRYHQELPSDAKV